MGACKKLHNFAREASFYKSDAWKIVKTHHLFSRWLILLALTGALKWRWPLFQIFTQSIDAIDVTSVTLSCLNSINAIEVTRCWLMLIECRMFQYSNVPMFQCSNVPIFQYSNVPMIPCSNVQMFKYSNVQMFKSECDIRENFDTNEYLNIFVSKSCYERISEYICIPKVDTNEYPNIFVSKKWYERMSE